VPGLVRMIFLRSSEQQPLTGQRIAAFMLFIR